MNARQYNVVVPQVGVKKHQHGVMLLEALVGLLIFSIGILGLVGMQAVATKNVSGAQFRSEASFLASEIMGQITVDQKGAASYAATGATCPPSPSTQLQYWACRVKRLPGADAYPPTITIVNNPVGFGVTSTDMTVTVVVRWKAPDATAPSNVTLVSNMGCVLSKPSGAECT